jgi:hypothetical protein
MLPGMNTCILERSIAIPIFTDIHAEDIRDTGIVQTFVLRLGKRVCGDENLFHVTGHSRDIRMAPRKPARIGFWDDELCVPVPSGGVCLLHSRLALGGAMT